jgi:N-acetylmuramoyl-L-alanine amidase
MEKTMEKTRRKRRLNPRFVILCLAAALLAAAGGVFLWRTVSKGESPQGVKPPDYVKQDFLSVNNYSRPGTKLETVKGVVIHYVGNPDTTAKANRNYFESLKDGRAGVHASAHFIVGLEGEVIQCIPMTEWAYASNQRNDDTLAIEVCHPDESGKFSPVTYDRLVELTAWVCQTFDLDEGDILRHYDVSGKECPKYYVENPESWDLFLIDVKAKIKLDKSSQKS